MAGRKLDDLDDDEASPRGISGVVTLQGILRVEETDCR